MLKIHLSYQICKDMLSCLLWLLTDIMLFRSSDSNVETLVPDQIRARCQEVNTDQREMLASVRNALKYDLRSEFASQLSLDRELTRSLLSLCSRLRQHVLSIIALAKAWEEHLSLYAIYYRWKRLVLIWRTGSHVTVCSCVSEVLTLFLRLLLLLPPADATQHASSRQKSIVCSLIYYHCRKSGCMTEAGVNNLHACFPHLLKANIRANLVANNNDVERTAEALLNLKVSPSSQRQQVMDLSPKDACILYRVMLGIGIWIWDSIWFGADYKDVSRWPWVYDWNLKWIWAIESEIWYWTGISFWSWIWISSCSWEVQILLGTR